MRLTIIREDNKVVVDGEAHTVDCSSLSADVHAVHWSSNGISQGGEVEYSVTRCEHCGARSKKGNELISDVAAYQSLMDAWKVAKTAADAERAKAAAEAAERASASAAGPQG